MSIRIIAKKLSGYLSFIIGLGCIYLMAFITVASFVPFSLRILALILVGVLLCTLGFLILGIRRRLLLKISLLLLPLIAAVYLYASHVEEILSSPGDSQWITVESSTEKLSLRRIASYDKIYFPGHCAFTDGAKIVFSVFGEGADIRFSYHSGNDEISYVFLEPKAENVLGPTGHGTDPLSGETYVDGFNQYSIEQVTKTRCDDTDDNTLSIRDESEVVMKLSKLGNIAMYFTDLDNDGFKEMFLVNIYNCEGIFELYLLDRRAETAGMIGV